MKCHLKFLHSLDLLFCLARSLPSVGVVVLQTEGGTEGSFPTARAGIGEVFHVGSTAGSALPCASSQQRSWLSQLWV